MHSRVWEGAPNIGAFSVALHGQHSIHLDRLSDLIDRFIAEHIPHLAPRNGGDQTSMMRKLVEPQWRNHLIADITPADVERLLQPSPQTLSLGLEKPRGFRPPSRLP